MEKKTSEFPVDPLAWPKGLGPVPWRSKISGFPTGVFASQQRQTLLDWLKPYKIRYRCRQVLVGVGGGLGLCVWTVACRRASFGAGIRIRSYP